MRVLRLLSTTLALVVVAGCSVGPTGPSGPTQIVVQNKSAATLRAVDITPCSADSWGASLLPSGTTIPPGGSYSFPVAPGCYDVQTFTTMLFPFTWMANDVAEHQTVVLKYTN